MMAGLLPDWTTQSTNKVLRQKSLSKLCASKCNASSYLHGGVVEGLDLLPQGLDLGEREHGQNAANDGQALEVVLLRVGPLLEVPGDGAQSIDDVLDQSGDGSGALDVSVLQVGQGRAVEKFKSLE